MFAGLVKHVDCGDTVIFLFETLQEKSLQSISSFDLVLPGVESSWYNIWCLGNSTTSASS
jgi:hypothetical protein